MRDSLEEVRVVGALSHVEMAREPARGESESQLLDQEAKEDEGEMEVDNNSPPTVITDNDDDDGADDEDEDGDDNDKVGNEDDENKDDTSDHDNDEEEKDEDNTKSILKPAAPNDVPGNVVNTGSGVLSPSFPYYGPHGGFNGGYYLVNQPYPSYPPYGGNYFWHNYPPVLYGRSTTLNGANTAAAADDGDEEGTAEEELPKFTLRLPIFVGLGYQGYARPASPTGPTTVHSTSTFRPIAHAPRPWYLFRPIRG